MIDTYTRLLEAVAELEDKKASDAALTKLITHLKSAGRMKMLPQIARELKKVAGRRFSLQPFLEVAHKKEMSTALKEAKKEGINVSQGVVNPSLINGWRARGNGKLVDRSAKAALLRIYQNSVV